MFKKMVLFFCFALFISIGSSCRINVLHGEGPKTTISPEVNVYNAINLSTNIKTVIVVQPDAKPLITISGYENIVKHIKTRIENNSLIVYCDLDGSWIIDNNEAITATLTLPVLQALSLEGAPTAEIKGKVVGNEFKLDISGAGKVTIEDISVNLLSADVSGAGKIEINNGIVNNVNYEISGAGKIEAFKLQADTVYIGLSGAGKGEITANKKLNINISGAGSIRYKGHPIISQDISGVGSIKDFN